MFEAICRKFVWYYKFIPISLVENVLTIAAAQPFDVKTIDDIRLHVGFLVKQVLTTETELNEALKKQYGFASDTIDRMLARDHKQGVDATPSMETTVIVLCILLGIAVVALGVIASLQVITGSSERKELQKLLKARDLPEFTTYAQKPEEEEVEDTSNLVELENMDSVIQEAIEKTIK